jgi:membrane protein YdbS with pleckstrin-like domain
MLMTATAADHPSPTDPSAANPSCPSPPAQTDEVDVWWGSYAGRTMWRSFLACVLATGVVSWVTWAWLPADVVKLAFVALAGAIWLVQGRRWSHRYFGYNYRLTTRRLFRQRGFLYSEDGHVELARVTRVLVKAGWSERRAGVGQVLVCVDKPGEPPLVLEGLRHPARVAEEIRIRVQRVREQETASPRAPAPAPGAAIRTATGTEDCPR